MSASLATASIDDAANWAHLNRRSFRSWRVRGSERPALQADLCFLLELISTHQLPPFRHTPRRSRGVGFAGGHLMRSGGGPGGLM